MMFLGSDRFRQFQESRSLAAAALFLFLLGIASGVGSIVLVAKSRKQLEVQNGILVASERLLSSMKDVETSYRGFALTGQDGFLAPFHAAEAVLPAQLAALNTSTDRREQLRILIDRKRAFGEAVVLARREGRPGVTAELSIMTNFRSLIADIQTDARTRMREIDGRESFLLPIFEIAAGVTLYNRQCIHKEL